MQLMQRLPRSHETGLGTQAIEMEAENCEKKGKSKKKKKRNRKMSMRRQTINTLLTR
jgi:hypothetical protein